MNHTEVDFLIAPLEPWRDILMAELGELGFDSFEETMGGMRAYIKSTSFDRASVDALLTLNDPHSTVTYHVRQVEPRNWNAIWEQSFQPIEIGDRVCIRADFHASAPGFEHEVVITPRMAFGTGHHATTRLMIQAMLDLDLRLKHVCDLGCGTAVLAILAERLGAASVQAIDIDEGAVSNAMDNVGRNGCQRIAVEKGTAARLRPRSCGAILANIERNTLMTDMRTLSEALLPGGALLLSGFVTSDREKMIRSAEDAGLTIVEQMNEREWALVGCRKK